MLKHYCTGVVVLFVAIAATGCTTAGPIGMDGRVKNINDLAALMSYKYNGGTTKVVNAQSRSKHHRHYGDFAMTLFNVRATMGDIPDMIDSFRNYCWYLGGVQKIEGMAAENAKKFSLACEPKELREVGKFRSRNDPAYYLYFVNVLLTPKFQPDDVAQKTDLDHASLYIRDREDAYRRNAHLDNPELQTTVSRLANGYYTNGHATHYRHSIGYYANHHHINSYSTAHPHTHKYFTKPLNPKNPAYTRYANTNPYVTVPRPARPANVGSYCINFLASENQTYNTALSKLPNYAKYRKQFEAVLHKTKAYC